MPPPSPAGFEAAANASNYFSWLRTQMALQRTLMAAVRTSVSLIGFGFTVAQFFQKLVGEDGPRRLSEAAPRNFGLVLIAAGVVSLAIFTWQYHRARHGLSSGAFASIAALTPKQLHSPNYLIAGAVMLIGVAAFGSVFLRF
ncbi:YidH family protein [Phenylobacterium sp. J367]|uniref:YidH family protein n=1 Tax=Phenylobacterium sp. J367 TaxID=2898435 RepID=UPI0021511B14|nr:DUF202 domain-containing protein [Phenylobacterium sp. J367]MCR5878884.1 DUF202 domain-containing protein [Phenylobacterium sp. J367]